MFKHNRIGWGSPDYLKKLEMEPMPEPPTPARQVVSRVKPVSVKEQIHPVERRKSKFQRTQ
jgi:hypothetical protein